MRNTKLLLESNPLVIIPELAKQIGLNEAIVLQQIHYWIEINRKSGNNLRDGKHWVYNSVESWKEQFPFWSRNTIQRTINQLEDLKLLVVGNYNKLKIDRTKWYRINYKVLEVLEQSPFTQNGSFSIPEWVNHLTNMGVPLPETSSETSSETNIYISELTDIFISCYREYFGKPHRKIKNTPDFGCLEDSDGESFKEIVTEFFSENPKDRCNLDYFCTIVERYK